MQGQDTVSLTEAAWAALQARLPADLPELARQTKALQRARGVPDAPTLLRLALLRGPGGLTLKATAAWACLQKMARLSAPALHDRLHQAVDFFKAVAGRLLDAPPVAAAPRCAGRHLRIADGTSISERGSQGTDWRVHGVFDLGQGGFSHLELTDAHGAEALSRGAPVAGELRIADRNFCNAGELARYLAEARDGQADFIVRMRWRSLKLRRDDGSAFDVISFLQKIPDGASAQDVWVHVELPYRRETMPLRLVAVRLPADKAAAARKKLMRQASRKQTTPDPRSLVAAGFVFVATTLPAEFTAADILALYRLRWQIELAFKRLKSLLHIDRIPTWTAPGGQSWLFAHLIMALLCDDLNQQFLAASPEEVLAAGYTPSLWRVTQLGAQILLNALRGSLNLNTFLNAGAEVHRTLADPPRKRQKQICYGALALT
jgi:hypothetical protein